MCRLGQGVGWGLSWPTLRMFTRSRVGLFWGPCGAILVDHDGARVGSPPWQNPALITMACAVMGAGTGLCRGGSRQWVVQGFEQAMIYAGV